MISLTFPRILSHTDFAFNIAVAILRLLTTSAIVFAPRGEMILTLLLYSLFRLSCFPALLVIITGFVQMQESGRQLLLQCVSREHFCTVPRPLASRGELKTQSHLSYGILQDWFQCSKQPETPAESLYSIICPVQQHLSRIIMLWNNKHLCQSHLPVTWELIPTALFPVAIFSLPLESRVETLR